MTKKARVRDPESKKKLILTTALKEFAKYGYSGARSERIATSAGVSVGTLFRIFTDKQNLANAAFINCLETIRELLIPALTAKKPTKEVFEEMWAIYVGFIFQNSDCLFFFEYQPTTDYISPENSLIHHQFRQKLLSWIEDSQKAGELKKCSAESLRAIAIGSLMRILRETREGKSHPTKQSLNELRNLIWNAISNKS